MARGIDGIPAILLIVSPDTAMPLGKGEDMKAFGTEDSSKAPRKRSRAWIYYGILAAASLAVAPSSHGKTILPGLALAAYAIYIFRGGKYVYWVW